MPLYEYCCAECGERFELLRRFQDADRNQTCPRCQSQEVERLLSSFASRGSPTAGCGPATGCGSGGGFT